MEPRSQGPQTPRQPPKSLQPSRGPASLAPRLGGPRGVPRRTGGGSQTTDSLPRPSAEVRARRVGSGRDGVKGHGYVVARPSTRRAVEWKDIPQLRLPARHSCHRRKRTTSRQMAGARGGAFPVWPPCGPRDYCPVGRDFQNRPQRCDAPTRSSAGGADFFMGKHGPHAHTTTAAAPL